MQDRALFLSLRHVLLSAVAADAASSPGAAIDWVTSDKHELAAHDSGREVFSSGAVLGVPGGEIALLLVVICACEEHVRKSLSCKVRAVLTTPPDG
jgi:hypothetical protein